MCNVADFLNKKLLWRYPVTHFFLKKKLKENHEKKIKRGHAGHAVSIYTLLTFHIR